MRISDWSSDVCSSDCPRRSDAPGLRHPPAVAGADARPAAALLRESPNPARMQTGLPSALFRTNRPEPRGGQAKRTALMGGSRNGLWLHRSPASSLSHRPPVVAQIGSASCRESVGQYVEHSGVAVSL